MKTTCGFYLDDDREKYLENERRDIIIDIFDAHQTTHLCRYDFRGLFNRERLPRIFHLCLVFIR
jgi:hypothetical protein